MIIKHLIFFDRPATHACDGRCDKAWGINSRPSVPSRADLYRDACTDPDDYAFLADSELGTAPIDLGIHEGGHAKPRAVHGPDDVNKWCVRECERAWLSPPGRPDATPKLPDYSVRHYNRAPHRRDPAPPPPPEESRPRWTPPSESPQEARLVADFAASLRPHQAESLIAALDETQQHALEEILRAVKKQEA